MQIIFDFSMGWFSAWTSSAPSPRAFAPAASVISWEATALGGISSLERVAKAMPTELAADEVMVRVKAIGLNFADIFCCLGLYEAANAVITERGGGSFCPGLEFSGDVLRTGSSVKDFAPGDKVYGFTRFGAYKSVVVQRAVYMHPMPADWSYAEAAALVAQGITAWHGLVPLGGIRKGSRVLVHSAAGGVGCCAMQIATSLGCEVTGVIGSDAKAPFLQSRFPKAQVVVRGPERRYKSQLQALPGGGQFDCCLDSLGGKYFTGALESLAPMGRIVHLGATYSYGGAGDGLRKWLTLVPGFLTRPRVDPGELVGTNRAVMGYNMIWLTEQVEMLTTELDEMLEKGGMLERPPAVGKTFPFEQLPDALHFLNSGTSVGKVVVTIDGEASLD